MNTDVDDTVVEVARFDSEIRLYLWIVGGALLIVSIVGIPLLVLWMLGGYFWTKRYYDRLNCHITPTHLVFERHALRRTRMVCPLDSIQSMELESNFLMDWFGLKLLLIRFENEDRSDLTLLKILGISNARGFRNLIQFQLDKKRASVDDRSPFGSK